MREFAFTVEYDPEADRLMDVFLAHPELAAKTVTCSVTAESIWRVDRLTGPTDAIEAVEGPFLDPDQCDECLHDGSCQVTQEYEVLSGDSTRRTIYTYQTDLEDCHSIPYLTAEHLGDGLLYEALRREGRHEWRILMRENSAVGELYDVLQSGLRDGLTLSLRHLGEPTHWCDEAVTAADLSYEQRRALEAAVEHGYYETPRSVSAEELADTLEIPRSTLQYRLRRAEAWLARGFVEERL
ncbi:transcriptional regulator [Halobacteriales archaeon QS_3_64_16]|nr:MAG: transcriptional regulator [Halobacteriales archaeon QS_3_64_16]